MLRRKSPTDALIRLSHERRENVTTAGRVLGMKRLLGMGQRGQRRGRNPGGPLRRAYWKSDSGRSCLEGKAISRSKD